ncbi:zinc-binding alcohol dehydrogenase family protein [Catenovulum sp. 2E275]|uniref:zinc-binding alcohol dehydrogenase family protein n=1 Tax=Catenovulum sp. 2E275 TaxID=2980497 RepID=UPI0021CE0694|nr:zinc-binding alcohol dehydrogenase family protein [Catenovulum sp. 2E275]MCU4677086.1 zinc-binding alcohol dehydrogenase family protein [Catenovulum sp. 2E275]
MKAIGYQQAHQLNDSISFTDIEIAQPVATGHDLLVKVAAISVNPVDFKIRQNVSVNDSLNTNTNQYKVLGWDAVGEVVATGDSVKNFQLGDFVYYAGDLTRQGSNAEYQLVDERIVGYKPKSLSNAQAAALPLTSITAWELLFKHLKINTKTQNIDSKEIILVTGAAGGVGSIFIQLAKQLTHATIIATASREASRQWVAELGADYIIDHTKPLAPQVSQLNLGNITHIASLNGTQALLDDFVELLVPFGKLALIDDPESLDVKKLKPKSISLHWEFMFTRSMFQTEDMIEQNYLLNQVAELIDQNKIKTTLGQNLGKINAKNLIQAHAILENGHTIGKIVLEGF